MPTPTYDLIASNVLSSSAATVTFTSIPSTYRDLVLVINCTFSASFSNFRMRVNDSTSDYNQVYMVGTGSSTGSGPGRTSEFEVAIYNNDTGQIRQSILQFLDYSATDKHKTALFRSNNVDRAVEALACRWGNTAAINKIHLFNEAGNFNSGSTFYLYGIVS